ncbi:MAG: FKBP-type peptidyl-prolyl cis-trans isomerase [Cyclobacteriaceae bacterium]
MKNTLFILLAIAIFTNCSTSERKMETESGVKLEFFKQGVAADKIRNAYVIQMNAFFRTSVGQQIVKTVPGQPIAMTYDSLLSTEQAGLLSEVLAAVRVGDSLYFELPAKNFWEKSFERPLPDSVAADEIIKVNLGVQSQMTIPDYQSYRAELERKANEVKFAEEREALDRFLEENNIETIKHESGLRYSIENKTNGIYPAEGQMVSVKYKGMLLDGSVFDEGTYTFPLGKRNVIQGWDIGMSFFRLGERGKLFIPSELGYSSRGSGAQIPPYSSLVFEVETVDIK